MTTRRSYMKEEYRGLSKTPEYRAWWNMIRRHHFYEDEWRGKLDDSVSVEWVNDFGKFLEDVGNRPTVFHVLSVEPGVNEWNRNTVTWRFRPPTSPFRKRMFLEHLFKHILKIDPAFIVQNLNANTPQFCHDEMLDEMRGISCTCDKGEK
ncbi:hypothetical protein [Streptomyces scabiei]|uniref:hypothetical protein n=1 Tax=Streptomyces scabiei TaxID=1930 RepID=UPI0029B16D05|nr:hypothetical protein [Streptomyces scabiei]MDX2689290.1 hypothetical protein [Streptomyces scabiei]